MNLRDVLSALLWRDSSPRPPVPYPPDFDADTIATIQAVGPYTQTSPERLFALCEAVKYVVRHCIPGDIVECGVWKGGSMMAAARILLAFHEVSRELYLYDTFEGMTAPSAQDVSYLGISASERYAPEKRDTPAARAQCVPLEETAARVRAVGYPAAQIHFIKGRVEDTLPEQAPDQIALLRLDTDWYESTRHELVTLYPRLAPGGVLIIDDYGHWRGARQAVDEYFQQHNVRMLLNRIDYTGRIGVVPG
jgi:O-methyltransferase